MNIKELKKLVCSEIDNCRDMIIEAGEKIYSNPELGYKENYATEYVENIFY